MSSLADFLQPLLHDGRATLRDPPQASSERPADAVDILRQAFATYRLNVACPLLELDEATALAAGRMVHQACWLLLDHSAAKEEVEKKLTMPGLPRSPAQHLSADLALRFLPQLYRRARALDPADPLPGLLATVLRQWPLTGVLAGVEEPPLAPLDFGHAGLQMLYAERLAEDTRSAWLPAGAGLEYVELVWRELGRDPSALLEASAVAEETKEGSDRDE